MKKYTSYFLYFLFFLLGIGSAFWYYQSQKSILTTDETSEAGFKSCAEQFTFISKEIDCSSINEKLVQIESLDRQIESLVLKQEGSGQATRVSVFFRDLNTRRWFGVNENVNFYPASLAKLPLAMMVYKTAEVDSQILNARLTISEEDAASNTAQHYTTESIFQAGSTYPVKDLVKEMLTKSDNAPITPLLDASGVISNSIFVDLGVYSSSDKGDRQEGNWNINARTYSNLFRVLYNSSYLRYEYSNTLLQNLSESNFKNGIVAGLPKDTPVAHKFGEASQVNPETNEKVLILNDCGIVYKKDAPYILCVMTQGKNYSDLEKIIQEISKETFDAL